MAATPEGARLFAAYWGDVGNVKLMSNFHGPAFGTIYRREKGKRERAQRGWQLADRRSQPRPKRATVEPELLERLVLQPPRQPGHPRRAELQHLQLGQRLQELQIELGRLREGRSVIGENTPPIFMSLPLVMPGHFQVNVRASREPVRRDRWEGAAPREVQVQPAPAPAPMGAEAMLYRRPNSRSR